DHHDLHELRQPNTTSLSRMATLLSNTSDTILIPFYSNNNYSIHNPN
ncbi:16051_t:CDS:1, partial [Funneliformis geosporum]